MKSSKIRVILIIVIVLIFFDLGLFFIFLDFKHSQVKETSQYSFYKDLTIKDIPKSDVYNYLINNLDKIILYQDIDGVTKLTREAFQYGLIDMFDCHTLAHEIGHHAAEEEHFSHIELHVSSENVNFCGGGFMHGVEGGLATYERPEFRQELNYFCQLLQPVAKTYTGCFHGAGHVFMKKSEEPIMALSLCDSLITNKNNTPIFCYRGVFSGYLENLKKAGKENEFLIGFCDSLPQKLHQNCALELNGLGVTPKSSFSEIEQAFRDCIENQYSFEIKTACLTSVSWAATDAILARQDNIVPPSSIFNLPKDLRQTYIYATLNSIKRQLRDGANKNWTSFCSSFSDSDDLQSCREYMLN